MYISNDNFEQKLAKLREAVYKRKPVFKDLLLSFGDKTVDLYLRDIIDDKKSYINAERQDEFLLTFKKFVVGQYGEERAISACEQLKKNFIVSTSDHTGPLSPPDFINSHLALANVYADSKYNFKELIVLACSNITLHNPTFPRGGAITLNDGSLVETSRIPFVSKSMVGHTLYGFRTGAFIILDKINDFIKQTKIKDEQISRKIKTLLTEISDGFTGEDFYYNFVKLINNRLWKKMYQNNVDNCPDLMYLEQESLVSSLLIENHLFKKTIIHELIFNPSSEILIKDLFDGIEGAFDSKNNLGTYLFWAIPPGSKYKIGLNRINDKLVSKDGLFSIGLNEEDIAKALEQKILIPSALVDFALLNFYYGLKCFGGTSQINYTTEMKKGIMQFADIKGDAETKKISESVPTNLLNCDLYLSIIDCGDEILPATGFDLAVYLDNLAFEKIGLLSKEINLSTAISPALPEYYDALYSKDELDEELASIDNKIILKNLYLNKKIKSIISI